MAPWINKYRPKTPSEIQGQDSAVAAISSFVKSYSTQKKKCALIYGPTGCGKTAAVHAIAAESNLEILELNASDFRNADKINSILGPAIQQRSLFFTGKLILVDEVDGLSGTKDRGGIQAILKLIIDSTFPIILTCNNPWESKFSSLRSKSEMIEFHTPSYLSVAIVLEKICKAEGVEYTDELLKTLARRIGGDLRAAVNDLQTVVEKTKKLTKESIDELSQRNKTESIPSALMRVFKTTDAGIAIKAFDSIEEDIDQQFLWIDENLPKEYTKPLDLARAYDKISKADVFKGRIRRWQHWRFLVYINTLLTAGVAVSKDEKYKTFVKYVPTMRLLKLWQAKMKYQKRKAIAEKIARHTHTSSRVTMNSTLPYLKVMFEKNKLAAETMANQFELNNEEVDWLRK